MERYMYSIYPYRTITNLIPGQGIRKPQSLKLTKDEVMKCIACGPVFRLFPGKPPIRVTGSNLDSLHVSSLEKEKEEVPSNYTETAPEEAKSEVEVPEEPKTEAPTEVIEEEKQEKKKFPYAISKQVGNKVETDLIENEDQERRYYETEELPKVEIPEETTAIKSEPLAYSDHETSPADEAIQKDIDNALMEQFEESVEDAEEELVPAEELKPAETPVQNNNNNNGQFNRKKKYNNRH